MCHVRLGLPWFEVNATAQPAATATLAAAKSKDESATSPEPWNKLMSAWDREG